MLTAAAMSGCGGDDDDDSAASETTAATGPAGADEVEVELLDHAYDVSGPLTAGGTLRVHNTGKEFHMIGLGRFKPGKDLEDLQGLLAQLSGGEAPTEEGLGAAAERISLRFDPLGAAEEPDPEEGGGEGEDPFAAIIEEVGMPGQIVGPGSEAAVTLPELPAGNYGMICFLNVAGEETPHFAKGMVGELEIVDGEVEAPEADATYTATPGQAVEGPAELAAGPTVIQVNASGAGSGELEPTLVKLNDGATLQTFAEASKLFEEGPLPVDAAAKLPGQIIVGLFDFGDQTTVYLTVDLTPGTYVLTSDDTDDEDSPDIPVELVEIQVT
jgi:hypothetical protein